jgi:hypothetical protein
MEMPALGVCVANALGCALSLCAAVLTFYELPMGLSLAYDAAIAFWLVFATSLFTGRRWAWIGSVLSVSAIFILTVGQIRHTFSMAAQGVGTPESNAVRIWGPLLFICVPSLVLFLALILVYEDFGRRIK